MPPKRGRGKNAIEEDNTPPGSLEIRVHCASSANTPVRTRMGHISYVHPRSGLLYVVAGCDVTGLPPILRSPRHVEPLEPLPFAEWWDRETRMWGVDRSGCATYNGSQSNDNNNNNNSNNNNPNGRRNSADSGDAAAVMETRQFPGRHHPTNVPARISWPTLAAAVVHWTTVHGTARTTVSVTATPPPSSPVPSVYRHVDADAVTAAPTATTSMDAVVDSAIGVRGAAKQGDASNCKAKASEESNIQRSAGEMTIATREHPVVLFIGGWQCDSRVSHVMGVDLDTGAVLQGRGSSSFAPGPTTCSTGSVLHDSIYIFGGNATNGYSPAVRTLDLSTCKWVERGTGTLTSVTEQDKFFAEPLPRSSHVAGLLLNRYIVVHGGRRLAPVPTEAPKRGKKVDAKMMQTIVKPGLDFCDDVAVYDVSDDQWVIPGVNVSNLGPAARYAHAACLLGPSELLIHGGIGLDGSILSDAWILRLEKREPTVTISWVKLIPHEEDVELMPARFRHALAKEAGEERRVYVTGGISAPGKEGDVCIIDIPPLLEMTVAQQEPRRRTTVKDSRRSRP